MARDNQRCAEGSTSNSRSDTSSSRRSVLKGATAGGLALTTGLAGCINQLGGGGGGSIKVGSLVDQSGALAVYGNPMAKATQLAVDQINANGGLLDRDVELVQKDPQSSNDKYQSMARQLILEENVDVLLGGISSASREAIRPIIDENKQLYFYPSLYEGGVCDEYTYLTGPVPTQQVRPLVEYMLGEYGNNVYVMAADYNFGQISTLWTQRYVEEMGGTVVNKEFIPLSVSDFSSSINRIENQDPDWIMSFLVGANHVQFFKQANSQGLQKPMGSTIQAGGAYEHKTLSPPALQDMHVSFNYLEELDSERNQEFVSNFRDKFPDTEYINQHAQSQYLSIQFWQAAVKQAGTADQQEVNSQLENGPEVNAPERDVTLDPETHHTNHDMHIFRVGEDHSLSEVKTIKGIQPTWLQERCSLKSESTWDDPTTKQVTPGE
jgi:branched-chain amino acid transport system substrate-binding protein